MGKIIVPVGLPASGKSTLARRFAEDKDTIILSSDILREELYGDVNDQSHNTEIFEEMNKRTTQHINEGGTVVYDATNLNRKRRVHLINQIAKNADEKIAYFLNVHYVAAIQRDEKRERTVGHEVIKKMYKNVQIPLKGEGWDEIHYTQYDENIFKEDRDYIEELIYFGYSHDDLFDKLGGFFRDFDTIYNLPHDSSYHKFSVSRHTYWVYRWVLDNYHGPDKLMLLWAALFHDIGKYFCKSFINHKGLEQKHANFIGHEYVSSQIAMRGLGHFGYREQFIVDTCALIQTHMMLYNDGGLAKAEKLIGKDLAEKLLILNTADRAAH